MKRVGVSVGLLVLAISTPSVAQNLVPLGHQSQPFEAFGFAIKAPQGTDWFVHPAGEDHVVAFYRYVGKRKDRHTVVAAVKAYWVSDCKDHESCLQKAAERASAGIEKIRVTKLELSKEGVDESTCRWMEKIEDDQRSKQKPLEVRVSGLFCTHPDEPKLVLQPAISERFKKGENPTADLTSNAKSFVETFEFRPIETTVASVVDVVSLQRRHQRFDLRSGGSLAPLFQRRPKPLPSNRREQRNDRDHHQHLDQRDAGAFVSFPFHSFFRFS